MNSPKTKTFGEALLFVAVVCLGSLPLCNAGYEFPTEEPNQDFLCRQMGPDLVITAIAVNPTLIPSFSPVKAGELSYILVAVKNDTEAFGVWTEPAARNFRISLIIQKKGAGESWMQDFVLYFSPRIDRLVPGQSYAWILAYTFEDRGHWKLEAVADCEGVVVELSETNNSDTVIIDVQ